MKMFKFLSVTFVMFIVLSGFVENAHHNFSNSLGPIHTAQLNDDFSVILNENQSLAITYEADVSHFKANMQNQQEAELFISNFNRPHIEIKVDLDELKAVITLDFNSSTSAWTVAQWNQYLK